MTSPESSSCDDHSGRPDDFVETFGDEMLEHPGFVKMSSGSVIRSKDLRRYQDQYEPEETDENHFIERAVAFGGAAALTFAAMALARRRLNKNE